MDMWVKKKKKTSSVTAVTVTATSRLRCLPVHLASDYERANGSQRPVSLVVCAKVAGVSERRTGGLNG